MKTGIDGMSENVTREEFNEVRDTVVNLQNVMSKVVQATEHHFTMLTGIDQSLRELSRSGAETAGAKGTIQLSNLWQIVGALLVAVGLVSGSLVYVARSSQVETDTHLAYTSESLKELAEIVKEHVKDGHPARVEALVTKLSDEFKKHEDSDGHPVLAGRVTKLEQTVKANHMENEAQHRWLADVFKLQMDWMYRTKGQVIPSPNYEPLKGIGAAPQIQD
mgnify:FL=1